MRGASALGKALAGAHIDVATIVVWEPVLASDVGPPTSAVIARVPDRGAVQFWDEDHQVAEALVRGGVAERDDRVNVLWDWVGFYPPGTRWTVRAPQPEYQGGPVVDAIRGVRARLGKALPARR